MHNNAGRELTLKRVSRYLTRKLRLSVAPRTTSTVIAFGLRTYSTRRIFIRYFCLSTFPLLASMKATKPDFLSPHIKYQTGA
jgi:hypothetical protein